MLYNGERVGNGQLPQTDVAVDPIDGTTLTSLGRANALSVIAVADRGTMFDPGPCVYMEKIATGPEAAHLIDITKSPTDNLKAVAEAKNEFGARPDRRDPGPRPPRRPDRRGARGRRPHQADPRRRCGRRHLHRLAQHRCRHPVRHRRHSRGRDHRGRHQVHGRRSAGPPVAPQRVRAQGLDQAGLRRGASANPGRPRQHRQLLLRSHRGDRRRPAPGSPFRRQLLPHPVAGDAQPVRHGAPHRGPAPPPEGPGSSRTATSRRSRRRRLSNAVRPAPTRRPRQRPRRQLQEPPRPRCRADLGPGSCRSRRRPRTRPRGWSPCCG